MGNPAPTSTNKIVELLAELITETKATQEALGILGVKTGDVAARQTQHTADIRELDKGLAATRQALDPQQLGKHVAGNIDHFMGPVAQNFAKGLQINLDAAKANQNAASNTANAKPTSTPK